MKKNNKDNIYEIKIGEKEGIIDTKSWYQTNDILVFRERIPFLFWWKLPFKRTRTYKLNTISEDGYAFLNGNGYSKMVSCSVRPIKRIESNIEHTPQKSFDTNDKKYTMGDMVNFAQHCMTQLLTTIPDSGIPEISSLDLSRIYELLRKYRKDE